MNGPYGPFNGSYDLREWAIRPRPSGSEGEPVSTLTTSRQTRNRHPWVAVSLVAHGGWTGPHHSRLTIPIRTAWSTACVRSRASSF